MSTAYSTSGPLLPASLPPHIPTHPHRFLPSLVPSAEPRIPLFADDGTDAPDVSSSEYDRPASRGSAPPHTVPAWAPQSSPPPKLGTLDLPSHGPSPTSSEEAAAPPFGQLPRLPSLHPTCTVDLNSHPSTSSSARPPLPRSFQRAVKSVRAVQHAIANRNLDREPAQRVSNSAGPLEPQPGLCLSSLPLRRDQPLPLPLTPGERKLIEVDGDDSRPTTAQAAYPGMVSTRAHLPAEHCRPLLIALFISLARSRPLLPTH